MREYHKGRSDGNCSIHSVIDYLTLLESFSFNSSRFFKLYRISVLDFRVRLASEVYEVFVDRMPLSRIVLLRPSLADISLTLRCTSLQHLQVLEYENVDIEVLKQLSQLKQLRTVNVLCEKSNRNENAVVIRDPLPELHIVFESSM